MTSGHRLIAIVAVWLALAVSLSLLFSTIFINHMPMDTVVQLTWAIAGAAVLATAAIAGLGARRS